MNSRKSRWLSCEDLFRPDPVADRTSSPEENSFLVIVHVLLETHGTEQGLVMDARSAPQTHHQCNAFGQSWPDNFGFTLICSGMVDGTMLLILHHITAWSALMKTLGSLVYFSELRK